MTHLPAKAQSLSFSGTVQDAHTRESIAYASIYFQKSGIGKTSDSAGNFSFVLNRPGTDTLIITYVGYKLAKIPLKGIKDNSRMVVQLERGMAQNDVFVKVKLNKGLFLWKKIMSKKKQYNRYNLSNFGYEAYNKLEIDIKNFKPDKLKNNFLLKPFSFVFDNIDSTSEKDPFLPAYLLESISDYAYQKSPKKFVENIKASNTKGFANESMSKLLGVMNQNVNIYGNYINVMDRDFVSPFNENADDYYNFSVPDTQIVNGRKTFHFVFKPKRLGQNTFEGDAWVVAQTFQIQKISLYLAKGANINYIDRISIFQEFIPLNDTVYFLNRDKFFADFNVLGKNSLTLIGRKTTSYRDIVISSDSLTSLFKEQNIEELVKTDARVANKNDEDWNAMRHDTLSVNEKAIYTTVDKLLAMPKFQKYQRNIRFLSIGYMDIGNYEIGPWFNWISANQWEGNRFRFDLGTNPGFHKNIYLHGYLAYGTTDQKFKGKMEAYWILKRAPNRFRLHLLYSNDIDHGISQMGDVSQDNIFSSLVRKKNITRKFLQLREVRFEAYKELGKGFSTEFFVSRRQFTPLQNLPYTFPTAKGVPLTSFAVAVQLRFAYLEQFIDGDYFRYSIGTKYPIVELMLVKGIPNIFQSAYNYSKVSLTIRDFVKISPYGSIKYKVFAGKVKGTLPFTFLENHPGNDFYYLNSSAFNLMTRFQYLSDQYAGINFEHNIGSGLFRFVPLTRKLKWRQFWNIKSLWGSLSQENLALNNNGAEYFKTVNGKNYLEIGTGIDNIFKVIRFDFIWSIPPKGSTIPQISRFGIFGSLQFQF